MGMFDIIRVNVSCLNCGSLIKEMQTKATACLLKSYGKGQFIIFKNIIMDKGFIEIHGECWHCKSWHEGFIEINKNRLGKVSIMEIQKK